MIHGPSLQDDIAMLIGMVVILFLTGLTVFVKVKQSNNPGNKNENTDPQVNYIDEQPNPNISTFRPLPQMVKFDK